MPLSNPQLDDEVLTDINLPLAGVNNASPPSSIGPTYVQDALNRLSQLDGLNRLRPGIIRRDAVSGTIDSIHHLGQGVYLLNQGATWYKYDYASNILSTLSGGPAYAAGAQVYGALSNATLYFSSGSTLNKYSVSGGFGTVTLPPGGPAASYPIWAVYRLIYAYQNTLEVSDLLNPESFHEATGSVTLDPIASDVITGMCQWQIQRIVVFRNGSTWVIDTGPGLDVPNWQLSRVSATVGCRAHGTIVASETDVYFLSETGRGVYKLSQAPATDQQGVWRPFSAVVSGYIDRINWSAASNARAVYWNDLYLLSVPLDGSTFNNYLLVYSVTLDQWQGLWCLESNGVDIGARGFAFNRADPNQTVLLIASKDGIISRLTYPVERQDYDLELDGTTRTPIESSLRSRAFNFGNVNVGQEYSSGQNINQIRPHSLRIQFFSSTDPVDITVFADRRIELRKLNSPTNTYLLKLPIPRFTFDLDRDGYRNTVIGLLGVGICTEIEAEIAGLGSWTVFQIKASAFSAMPLIAT